MTGRGTRRASGSGSIYYRQRDGVWTAAITVAGQRHTHACRTEREAERWLERVAAGAGADALTASNPRLTVARYLERWLEDKRHEIAASTAVLYEQFIRVHIVPAIGHLRLTALAPADLLAIPRRMRAAGRAEATVHRVHTLLHGALRRAERLGILERNPADLVDPPRERRDPERVFDLEESRRLLDAIRGDRWEALWLLAIATGMREGELLALRWQDVDLDRGLAVVARKVRRVGRQGMVIGRPKTRAGRRTVALMGIAVAALRRHRSQQSRVCELVFPSVAGTPMEGQNIRLRYWYPLLDRAGLPRVKFHALRHSAATLLLAANVPAPVIAGILGHADVGTTLRTYAHSLRGADVAAMARLEELLTGQAS